MRDEPHLALTKLAIALGVAAIALLPLSGQADQSRRETIQAAMHASVFVLSADIINGRVVPVSSGSGTIVSEDGSIVTNHHVLNDKAKGRLHDVFLIGRFKRADQDPELVCAGQPSAGHLLDRLDLALIKCTIDLEGRPYQAKRWPTIPVGDSTELIPGEKITVLGYPGIGGSTIHVTSGELSGWSGEDGGAGRAFIKTDAHIAHGNSGGTALNEAGNYIGVPTAFRVHTEEIGGSVATSGKVGLIRPIEHAEGLIAIAHRGWTPEEKPLTPASDAGDPGGAKAPRDAGDPGGQVAGPADPPPPAEPARPAKPAAADGVTVLGRIVDSANGAPIRGAFMVVFKPEINKGNVDFEKVEEQALTYGQTNKNGEFELLSPVPRGTYMVAVVADGYQPLLEEGVLRVGEDTPARYEPWDEIVLERR